MLSVVLTRNESYPCDWLYMYVPRPRPRPRWGLKLALKLRKTKVIEIIKIDEQRRRM
jgi:hypothetical protein